MDKGERKAKETPGRRPGKTMKGKGACPEKGKKGFSRIK